MVHGQEHRCRFKPFMEQYCYWKVIQHFCLTKVLVWLVLGFCAMSRCFPFPWPGYERKARVDDLDLLKKEKQREKKQKKEKKDKREKDKSDGKHKEKKDKRKVKEKTGNLDEKRLPAISDGHIGEKVSNNKRFPGQPEGQNGKKVSNEKRFPGFEDQNGERVSNERRLPMQSEGHGVEKTIPDEQDKHRNNFSNERNSTGKAAGHNGEVIRSIPFAEETRDSKFDQGFDGRVKEEEAKGAGNDNVSKFTGAGQKRDGGMPKSVYKATSNGAGWNGKEKDKRDNGKTIDRQGFRDEAIFSKSSMVQDITEVVQPRVEGIGRLLEKKEEKGGDDKPRDQHKNTDMEKKSQVKEKERKKEEKENEKKETKTVVQGKVKESLKNDTIGSSHGEEAPYPSEDIYKRVATEGNHRKRKNSETNGFLHGNGNSSTKSGKPTLPSYSSLKNGRISESCQTLVPSSSDKQGTSINVEADGENQKINGTTEARPFPVSLAKPSPSITQAVQITEAPRKPPHPDSRFLSQILSVPKMEELSESDEQHWLFSSNASKMECYGDDETAVDPTWLRSSKASSGAATDSEAQRRGGGRGEAWLHGL